MKEIKNTSQLEIQQDFLRDALKTGAINVLDTRRRNLVGIYYGTQVVSYEDLIPLAGNTTLQNVRRRVQTGVETIWEHTPSELQAKYPLEQVKKGKRVSGTRSPATRQKDSGRLKQLWQEPGFRDAALKSHLTTQAREHERDAHRQLWQEGTVHRQNVLGSYQSPEVKAKKSANAKKQLSDPEALKNLLEAAHSTDARRKLSESKRRQWKDPAYRKKVSEAIRRGMRRNSQRTTS